MASHETSSDKIEIHWKENDGHMATVWAESLRPRPPSVERILRRRDAVTEPMALPLRPAPWRGAAITLVLLCIFLACVVGLLR